jgi:CspA family cold shock protein
MIKFTGFYKYIRSPTVAKFTSGVVRWYDGSKGFGYIDTDEGEEVFVHHSEFGDESLSLLLVGERVGFYLERSLQGFTATDVTRIANPN